MTSLRSGAAGDLDLRRLRRGAAERPFLVLLELTRACDLRCQHCRAEAAASSDPEELDTSEVRAVLDDLAALGPPRPIVVFTGGDPLQRGDLAELVRHASAAHLAVGISPAGTPRASQDRLVELRQAGARTVSLSIDGASADAHDAFRQVPGSFSWTLAACDAARKAGMRLQVNTTVTKETVLELPGVCRLAATLGASLWSVFFLVPVGRGRALEALSGEETEDVLAFLSRAARHLPVKTTEAPHYRRVLGERPDVPRHHGPLYDELCRRLGPDPSEAARSRRPLAVGDGRGVVFVSHLGEIMPSGFLPLVAGNVRDTPLSRCYPTASLLRALRDPDRLRGRCGRCEHRVDCGGSRAQAWARTGDVFGEDPTCTYQPPGPVPGAPERPGRCRTNEHRAS